ncbi:MAG: rkpN: putative acylneuraminate cytidylyltransferase [Osedax symbiont Rs1]|nr:MAG: rkpN: putative acylneuraminate cytidylyltransferase [Osedax symbiont Rs1]
MKVALIPARGGSKRIPKKNIKLFHGQPIISYAIKAAIQSGCFDKVVVSTDDQEIANIAKKYGADVPFERPANLATDHTGTIPVIVQAIEWFRKHEQPISEICCIYPTAPFLTGERIAESYQLLKDNKADYCFSVTEYQSPIQRALRVDSNLRLSMLNPEQFEKRSQDLENCYHDAGQFYWGKAQSFVEQKKLFSEYAVAYRLPHYLVQDIDTPDDWIRAELMYTGLKGQNLC